MKPLTAKQTEKILLRHGFQLVRQKGSHRIYRNSFGVSVPVPFHGGNKALPIGTFRAIVKQSRINPEAFS